jgi:hypothetical protein
MASAERAALRPAVDAHEGDAAMDGIRSLAPVLLALGLAAAGLTPAAAGELKDGALAWSRGDHAAVLRLLGPLAERGDATAQYLVGSALANAPAARRDPAQARTWLAASARQGNLAAATDLAKLMLFGTTPPERAPALALLRQASERGHPEAQHLLGVLSLDGETGPPNPVEAYKWLLLATERGHVPSGVILAETQSRYGEREREQGRREAQDWRPQR